MIWLIYLVALIILQLILVPRWALKFLYPVGIVSVIVMFIVDHGLIDLYAYSFPAQGFFLYNLPVLYVLGGFPGGVIMAYFLPNSKVWRLPYIIVLSLLFLGLEWIMYLSGYFVYLSWDVYHSILLNIIGFTCILFISDSLGLLDKGKRADAKGNII